MSWSEIVIDGNGVRQTRRGGTLTGETGAFTVAPPEPEPGQCSPVERKSWDGPCWTGPYKQPVESVQQLPELKAGAPITKPASAESTVKTCFGKDSKEPEPEPKPTMVMWRLCVKIEAGEIDDNDLDDYGFYLRWYPSGSIPEHWYPLELQWYPVKTFKELPEGELP